MGSALGLIVFGLVLLAGGGESLLRGAVAISALLRLTPAIIGLTVVAAGTSLPEIVASLMSTIRGRDDIAISNVVGSNIFNILGILGSSALVRPLPIHASISSFDGWWMLGIIALLFPMMYTRLRIDRWEGAGLSSSTLAMRGSFPRCPLLESLPLGRPTIRARTQGRTPGSRTRLRVRGRRRRLAPYPRSPDQMK